MPKKIELFEKERKEILRKIFDIIGVTEENNAFILKEIEKNPTTQKSILELVPSIKKYFNCGKWNYFSGNNVKNPATSIIRSVLKDMGYSIDYKSKQKKLDNGKTIKFMVHYINKIDLTLV